MSYLSCPRCGLSVYQRHLEIALQYCPRCVAHARIAVLMETSTAPSADRTNPPAHRSRSSGRLRPGRERGRGAPAGDRLEAMGTPTPRDAASRE
jgi:Zn-finger nucleic acid-binding protein